MNRWNVSLVVAFAHLFLSATEPKIAIVFPAASACVPASGRVFVIGSVTPPDTPFTVNGQTVTVWRTGGFLHMAPVKPGTNTLACRAGATEYRHTFTVPFPSPAWDGKSLRAQQPLQPLGVYTGETVKLACRAPAGRTVCADIGERILTLSSHASEPTLYTAKISFPFPVETVPVIFYSAGLPDAPAAPLTARPVWPTYRVTGPLFETRARSEPGDGDTAGFLPPGFLVQGSGCSGAHTRLWLAGIRRFAETRHLTPVAGGTPPPRDQPVPDLAAGFSPHPPTNRTPAGILVVLDPGHGGSSSGAIGPTGLTEKQANLEQARIVKAVLEQAGFNVLLTRNADIDLDLYERARLAYGKKADAFISIHYNSCGASGNPRASRHIATYAWNGIGLSLARALHPHLAAATPIQDGGVHTASFAVCRNPAIPSCLLELDFITCPEGEEALQQKDRQRRVAEALLAGLRDWLTP